MKGRLKVELSTPRGIALSGEFDSIEMKTSDGVIEIRPGQNRHFSFAMTSEITLRVANETIRYSLENASAGLGKNSLTVIAQTARRLILSDVSPQKTD